MRDDGLLITPEEFHQLPPEHQEYPYNVTDGLLLAPENLYCPSDNWRMNHSCEPTAGYQHPFIWVALRNIAAGEEVTFDYAIAWTEVGLQEPIRCTCRSRHCRGLITSSDWKIPLVQKKYRGFFTPDVEAKILHVYGQP